MSAVEHDLSYSRLQEPHVVLKPSLASIASMMIRRSGAMSLEQADSPPDVPASVVAINCSISIGLSLRDSALSVEGLWVLRRAQLNGRGLHATIQRRRRKPMTAQSVDLSIMSHRSADVEIGKRMYKTKIICLPK